MNSRTFLNLVTALKVFTVLAIVVTAFMLGYEKGRGDENKECDRTMQYVSPNGDDANDGSRRHPKKTFAAAVDALPCKGGTRVEAGDGANGFSISPLTYGEPK